jgi:glutamate synthase (NADPH/NADH) small chain
MVKPGFIKYKKKNPSQLKVQKRLRNYNEFQSSLSDKDLRCQTDRCMDCGTPFCHSSCPLGNMIPEFNDAVSKNDWKKAYKALISTNNFPEFTGRICPAPCEHSCVLGINQDPVTIENIEKQIIEKAFLKGYVKPHKVDKRIKKKIAIVGSGPAGLSCADQLNKKGYKVTVYEKDEKVGGLLRFGIPDFKLEKKVIDRRVKILEKEGIIFQTSKCLGKDITVDRLDSKYDAIILSIGSSIPKDISIEGRELEGIHFAMDFLTMQNRINSNLKTDTNINAKNKNVIVLGGGDTGSDCIGTSNRHGAKTITQIELLPRPPKERDKSMMWPLFANTFKTSSSHEEGCDRVWGIKAKEFVGKDKIEYVRTEDISWDKHNKNFYIVKNSENLIPCYLLLIAIGYESPNLFFDDQFSIDLMRDGRIKANNKNFLTSKENFFTCGDSRRGQSLVVWAIKEGRDCAESVHNYLKKKQHT